MNKKLTAFEKRCEDCVNLVTINGKKCCGECFNQLVNEIDDCPEGMTIEEVSKMVDIKYKVDHDAKKDAPKKERKPRTSTVSAEKQELFAEIEDFLLKNYENVEILNKNKLFCLNYKGKTFKLDLIEQKKKKK